MSSEVLPPVLFAIFATGTRSTHMKIMHSCIIVSCNMYPGKNWIVLDSFLPYPPKHTPQKSNIDTKNCHV